MKTRWLRRGLVLLLASGIALAWLNRSEFAPETITTYVRQLGFWGPLAFVGIYCFAPAPLLPGSVLTLAGGALFGPVTGALLSLIGATVGATMWKERAGALSPLFAWCHSSPLPCSTMRWV